MRSFGLKKELVSLDDFMKGPKSRPITSPRSLEACLRQGLDPAELLPTPLSKFMAEESVKEVAIFKHQHLEERRVERLSQARAERELIIKFLDEARKTGATRLSPSFQKLAAATAPSETSSQKRAAASAGADAASSMLEEEKRRVEALKRRQQKDIEQMMAYEMNIVKMQKEQKRLEEIELQKKAARQAEREKKRLAAVQRRAKRELAKKMAEDEEEERMKEQARRDHQFEMRRKKLQLEKEKQMKREARERDMERRRQQAAREKQIADMQAAQEEAIRKRLAAMAASEKRRMARLAREKQEYAEKQAILKRAARERIAKAVQANEAIQHKKQEDFWEKERLNAERQKERIAAEKELQKMKMQKLQAKIKKRIQARDQAMRLDEENTRKIERERRQREKRVLDNAANRYATDMVAKAREEMRKKDKLDNIERMKRIDEFVRLQTLQKIAADEDRTKRVMNEKADLLKQRKLMAAKQRLSKARLSTAIDRLRQTQRWDKLDQAIDEALSPSGKKKKRRRKKKTGKTMTGSRSAPSFSHHP